MKELIEDGWRKPRSAYRSFLGGGVLTVGVIAIVCLSFVLVCHWFETPTPEANALRYTYAHSVMIVAIASMIFEFTAIHVTLKLNDDYNWHEFRGLMSVLKNVYTDFLIRTQSHHARPVYWDALSQSWVEQESANRKGV